MNSKLMKLSIAALIAIAGYLTILSLLHYQQPYLTVSEAIASPKKEIEMKIAGKVVANSLKQGEQSGHYQFQVADAKTHLTILYSGVLPDQFRNGGEIVATGVFLGDLFHATHLLTKCPSKYQKKMEHQNRREQ